MISSAAPLPVGIAARDVRENVQVVGVAAEDIGDEGGHDEDLGLFRVCCERHRVTEQPREEDMMRGEDRVVV